MFDDDLLCGVGFVPNLRYRAQLKFCDVDIVWTFMFPWKTSVGYCLWMRNGGIWMHMVHTDSYSVGSSIVPHPPNRDDIIPNI